MGLLSDNMSSQLETFSFDRLAKRWEFSVEDLAELLLQGGVPVFLRTSQLDVFCIPPVLGLLGPTLGGPPPEGHRRLKVFAGLFRVVTESLHVLLAPDDGQPVTVTLDGSNGPRSSTNSSSLEIPFGAASRPSGAAIG